MRMHAYLVQRRVLWLIHVLIVFDKAITLQRTVSGPFSLLENKYDGGSSDIHFLQVLFCCPVGVKGRIKHTIIQIINDV